ncbi:hypothetical protein EVAR_24683_1 [Eumeta japonica]|uniref:Uncharacterized protein n=1 Tax=Eumeta variegata TaxID=151549 RepID=A0A4C1WDD1_EUMVA|nr:hypothetical protein EVAR_24683_1 [Eumeta japonica]
MSYHAHYRVPNPLLQRDALQRRVVTNGESVHCSTRPTSLDAVFDPEFNTKRLLEYYEIMSRSSKARLTFNTYRFKIAGPNTERCGTSRSNRISSPIVAEGTARLVFQRESFGSFERACITFDRSRNLHFATETRKELLRYFNGIRENFWTWFKPYKRILRMTAKRYKSSTIVIISPMLGHPVLVPAYTHSLQSAGRQKSHVEDICNQTHMCVSAFDTSIEAVNGAFRRLGKFSF